MRTVPAKKVVLDVLIGKLGEENLHLVIKTGIVGWSTYDEALVAEDVAQDVAVVSLRDIIHHDVLHASLACRTGDDFSHTLGVAIHGAVADNEARLRLVLRHLIIHADYLLNVLVPNRTMG